jgi:anti-sigma B factor antagonist
VRPTLELSPLIGAAGIKLAGEVDLATAPQLSQALANIRTESEVLLELSDLTFMDSSGVSVILAFAKSRNGGGPLVMVNPSAGVERLFELTCLEQHPKVEVRHMRSRADAPESEPLAAGR